MGSRRGTHTKRLAAHNAMRRTGKPAGAAGVVANPPRTAMPPVTGNTATTAATASTAATATTAG